MCPQMSSLCPQPDFPASEMSVLWLNVLNPFSPPSLADHKKASPGRSCESPPAISTPGRAKRPRRRNQSVLLPASENHRPYWTPATQQAHCFSETKDRKRSRGRCNLRCMRAHFPLLRSVPSLGQLRIHPRHQDLPENLPAPEKALLTSSTCPDSLSVLTSFYSMVEIAHLSRASGER